MEFEYDVFIAHDSEQEQLVKDLAENLTLRRYAVWFYEDPEPPETRPANFVARVSAAMESSARCLVLLSKAALESEWVQDEWTAALELRHPIVVLQLDPQIEVPALLRTRTRVEAFNQVQRLQPGQIDSICRALGPPRGAREYPFGHELPFDGLRWSIAPDALNRFMSGAHSHLDIVGHSLSGLLDPSRAGLNSVLQALKNGAKVRLLYLDPTQDYSQQISEIRLAGPQGLREKIRASLDQALAVKRTLGGKLGDAPLSDQDLRDVNARFQVAVTRRVSYAHIQRADDVIMVSHYSQAQDPGYGAPTREVTKWAQANLFYFYLDEFERMWRAAEPWEEASSAFSARVDRSRVLRHLDAVRRIYRSVHNDRAKLPYPRMLVVTPTLRCAVGCPNCCARELRRNAQVTDMELDLFKRVLDEAQRMEVTCVELSGGGEPLEHPQVEKLLQACGEVANRGRRKPLMGMLSNGLWLYRRPELADLLIRTLGYIRLSFAEKFESDTEAAERFWSQVRRLVSVRSNAAAPRIGVKLLLTSQNLDEIEERVRYALDLGADHVKVKSIRAAGPDAPSIDHIRDAEHRLADLKAALGSRDLQIDLKPTYVDAQHFRCWINPLLSVIDSSGRVYVCCNFAKAGQAVEVGAVSATGAGYDAFWGGARHRHVIENIPVDQVCNSQLGSHCRLVDYQERCAPYVLATSGPGLQVSPFNGHSEML